SLLPQPASPDRDRLPRHRPLTGVPLRAGDKRLCRALHPDAEGTGFLWIDRFETFDQLRKAVSDFARRYNQEWLLERHGYVTPIEASERLRAATERTTDWPGASPESLLPKACDVPGHGDPDG